MNEYEARSVINALRDNKVIGSVLTPLFILIINFDIGINYS